MPDAVLYTRPGAHERKDQAACLATAERLGYGIESVTTDVDAALGVVEAGEAKVLLVIDPRALGERLDEVRRRMRRADAILEYCKPSPRRAAKPDVTDRARRALILLREAAEVLEGIPHVVEGRSPGRPTRRPRPRHRPSPEQPSDR